MCGITGAVWSRPESEVSPAALRSMTDTLVHRGPDDSDTFWRSPWSTAGTESTHENAQAADFTPGSTQAGTIQTGAIQAGVGLGFRRLSIIDLQTGRQPISNEDNTIQVVFNGEIYNYQQLRHRLEGNGHLFRTSGDAETIVHLYEDEGEKCFAHLNGMFSIAIWDGRKKQLLLARDRAGQKSLFYYHDAQRLIFGSELKAVLAAPGVPREISLNAIDQFLLYQYIPHPNTIYRDISALPPGHFARWQPEQSLQINAYWKVPTEQASFTLPETTRQVQQTLEDSVRLRLQSDVPLGVFLSGGIDSSLIAALAQRQSDQPVETFSIGFQESEYDESRYSKMVSDHLGTRHQSFVVQPDAIRILPDLVQHYDQPFGDSSAIPTWYLSKMTRQSVTVALSGDGSDELFAGYQRYRAAALASLIDRTPGAKAILASSLWQKIPSNMSQRNHLRRWKRFCEAMSLPPLQRYMQWIGIFHDTARANLYSDSFLQQMNDQDPLAFVADRFARYAKRHPVTGFSLMDLETYLPCDLNTKVDIASMAHSLEVRQPFLDYRLIELAAGMPSKWKLRRGSGKWILKQAFSSLLPAEIWARRKQGFGVPLDHWFRGPLRELACQRLLGTNDCQQSMDQKSTGGLAGRGLFSSNEIRTMLQQHVAGKFDHAYRLWSLLILESWLERWAPDFQLS